MSLDTKIPTYLYSSLKIRFELNHFEEPSFHGTNPHYNSEKVQIFYKVGEMMVATSLMIIIIWLRIV